VSRAAALVKLAKAAKLNADALAKTAEAQRLFLEAAQELGEDSPTPEPPVVTEFDVARAKRALRKVGARVR
jgi:hypothetical protein